ncbi:unnamed protein product, partial [Prorocentrum cordatum]
LERLRRAAPGARAGPHLGRGGAGLELARILYFAAACRRPRSDSAGHGRHARHARHARRGGGDVHAGAGRHGHGGRRHGHGARPSAHGPGRPGRRARRGPAGRPRHGRLPRLP